MVQTRAGVLVGRHVSRGFTLVELMIVVAIMSVLATLAVYGVRKYIETAKSHEATNMIKDIKEGQETFRRETDRYLQVTADLKTYYPARTAWGNKVQWGGGDADVLNAWKTLNVHPDGPTYYSYASVAGSAGQTPPAPFQDESSRTYDWPITTGPWYVVKAVSDLNDNGTFSVFVGSSFTNEIATANEGE